MKNRLKAPFVLLLTLLTACSDADDKSDALTQPRAELVESGYVEITLPGDASYHANYLPEETPEGITPEFGMNGGNIYATSDQITVLESNVDSTLYNTVKQEELDTDPIAINAFGSSLVPGQLSPISGEVDIYNHQKFIIHVNERRYIAMLKIGTYVGGYDRHQFVWALYEMPQ